MTNYNHIQWEQDVKAMNEIAKFNIKDFIFKI